MLDYCFGVGFSRMFCLWVHKSSERCPFHDVAWAGFLCSAKCLHGSEPCAKHWSSAHTMLGCSAFGESEFWWVERGSRRDERLACAGNGKGAFGDCLPKRRSLQPEWPWHTWDVPPSLDLRLLPPALFEPFLFSFLLISSSTPLSSIIVHPFQIHFFLRVCSMAGSDAGGRLSPFLSAHLETVCHRSQT